MKSPVPMFLALALSLLLVSGARDTAVASGAPLLQPDRLVVLSTADVLGKTSPCGCSTPRGGLARRASFVDSIRASYGQVMLVDAGGYFPIEDGHEDVALFMMDAMRMIGMDAVTVAERDLRFGRSFLVENARSRKVPTVCANLHDASGGTTLFPPYLIKKVGNVQVGVFGLITDRGGYGPATDSIQVSDPAARSAVQEMRARGASVVVLLSQLGKVESEDLVAAVDGIDAVIIGRNVPMLPRGRMIKNTVACYGGEQGQYIGRTLLTLDAKQHMVSGESGVFALGPTIADKTQVLEIVTAFEESFNRKIGKPKSEADAAGGKGSPAAAHTHSHDH
jgi:2',3'-cyclic-nucleotide 2'-phosphodiesterase (5'-nucleotidase family)